MCLCARRTAGDLGSGAAGRGGTLTWGPRDPEQVPFPLYPTVTLQVKASTPKAAPENRAA